LQILDTPELGCLNGIKVMRTCGDQIDYPGRAAIDLAGTLTVKVERQAGDNDQGSKTSQATLHAFTTSFTTHSPPCVLIRGYTK
jgi:hypothetical protein